MPPRPRSPTPQIDPSFAAYSAEQVAHAIHATTFAQAEASIQQRARPEVNPAEVERYILVARTAGRTALREAAAQTDTPQPRNGLELMQRLNRYAQLLMAADDRRFTGTPWSVRANRTALARHITTFTRLPYEELMAGPRRTATPPAQPAADPSRPSPRPRPPATPERPATRRQPERPLSSPEDIDMLIRTAGETAIVYVNGPDSSVGPSGNQRFGPGRHSDHHYGYTDFLYAAKAVGPDLLKQATDIADVPVETVAFIPSGKHTSQGERLIRVYYSFNPLLMGDHNSYASATRNGGAPDFKEFVAMPGSQRRSGGSTALGLTLPESTAMQLLATARTNPTFLRDLTGRAVTALGPPEYANYWHPHDTKDNPSMRPPYEQLPANWKLWIFDSFSPNRKTLAPPDPDPRYRNPRHHRSAQEYAVTGVLIAA